MRWGQGECLYSSPLYEPTECAMMRSCSWLQQLVFEGAVVA